MQSQKLTKPIPYAFAVLRCFEDGTLTATPGDRAARRTKQVELCARARAADITWFYQSTSLLTSIMTLVAAFLTPLPGLYPRCLGKLGATAWPTDVEVECTMLMPHEMWCSSARFAIQFLRVVTGYGMNTHCFFFC